MGSKERDSISMRVSPLDYAVAALIASMRLLLPFLNCQNGSLLVPQGVSLLIERCKLGDRCETLPVLARPA